MLFGNAFNKSYVSSVDERDVWVHSLDDETKGLSFSALGSTFEVFSTKEDCNHIMQDLTANTAFVTNQLSVRGFESVSCVSIIGQPGREQIQTATSKIAPVKPLPKSRHNERTVNA